jgi:peptidoglycan/xylan/chitin deacetylase (PgdA/CDA1 family)
MSSAAAGDAAVADGQEGLASPGAVPVSLELDFDISPARMRTKKLARRAAVATGRVLRSLGGLGASSAQLSAGAGSRPTKNAVRVLTYHRFGRSPLDPCCIDPAHFEEQLDWLQANADVLSPAQFEAVMSGCGPAPQDAVLITIDDGHASVATHALPSLDRRGITAVLFVCPMLVGHGDRSRRQAHPPAHGGFMDWHALAAAKAKGHVVAPHGHSHRSLGRMPLAEALHEVDQAVAALQAHLDESSRFFSFPFGTRADYSPALADALAHRGFRYCFTSSHGRCLPGAGSVLMPRIKIEGGEEQHLFPHIVRGCMDHWRLVDTALSFLQQRGRM